MSEIVTTIVSFTTNGKWPSNRGPQKNILKLVESTKHCSVDSLLNACLKEKNYFPQKVDFL